ncbi:MAG: hypothetical protein HC769_11545 [Cyanobacteria bacterium CRU_2_1]|nr:hypothetical protein [Cyanobacteria bacterium CRU_2_1]
MSLSNIANQSLTSSEIREKRHLRVAEMTHRKNADSDYTEKMKELGKSFNYSSHSNDYWSEPELSTLYGTPIYETASPSQKLALNHLYWAAQYAQVATDEAAAVVYNQLTSGVFSTISGYGTLCQELDLESHQERDHLRTFQTIAYKTKLALLGETALMKNPLYGKKLDKPRFTFSLPSSQVLTFQDSILRFVSNIMLKNKADYCYSPYLKDRDKEGKSIPAPAGGIFVPSGSQALQKFLILHWGSSPFMACQYYSGRFVANMLLKSYEYGYVKHFKKLEEKGQSIPAPTAVSYYHFLDESFHTTTSQLIARDVRKDFSKPTAYEKFVANLQLYGLQRDVLSGISAGVPSVFRDDASFLLMYYRLLRSPVFDMSVQEALHWMQRCLCEEHEGFHANVKSHQRLLSSLRNFFDGFDYLWPMNREMRLMASGDVNNKAIQRNARAFNQFSRTVAV